MSRTRLAALLAVIAMVVAACGGSAAGGTTAAPTTIAAPTMTVAPSLVPVTIAASTGAIAIPAMPTRIVSLSASHTEMLFAIGAGDQVVATDMFSNYPPESPTTDLSSFALNVESILGFDTDLVVIDGDWDGVTVGALTDLAVPVLVLPPAASFDDVYAQIGQLGAATGHTDETAVLVGQMKSDFEEILASIPPSDEARTFYHELDSNYFSVTSETFLGRVYGLMGLVNIADAAGEGTSGYPQLSGEYILDQDPDLIFLADTICCGVSGESLKDRPGWDTLMAVRNGSVVELNDDVASRWGPRIIDFMRAVADALAALPVNP